MRQVDDSQLKELGAQLREMAATVVYDEGISDTNVRRVLRFINKVVQVVDQAFEDVYGVLNDVRLLGQEDLESGRPREIRRELGMLLVRSRYKEAEEICSRLHHLAEEYSTTIQPIVADVEDRRRWTQVYFLLDEFEGRIIEMVKASVNEMDEKLASIDPDNLRDVRDFANRRANEVQAMLRDLGNLRNQILGLSGSAGLLELLGGEERDAATTIVREVVMGDRYEVRGAAGAVGRGARADNVTIKQVWNELDNQNSAELAAELSRLRAEMKLEAKTPEQDLAVAEVARAELAAENGDGPGALEHLAGAGKWALGIATTIGTAVAAAAIKAAMGL